MNKRVLNLIVLFAFLLLSATAYSQAVTMTTATGGLAGAAQLGGTADIAILGVQLNKAAGGGNTVTTILVGMIPTPVGKFTNARLYESADATFAGIGSETFVANGIISATDITFTGAPLTNFDGATALADDEFFFIVVDVSPLVTTGATTTPSLASTGVTVSTGSASGTTITGATYTFTALEADFTQNADDATALGDEDDVTLLDFTVNSSGTQSVNSTLTFTFSTDVTNILENFDLQVGGVNIAGAETYPLTGGGTILTVTGFTAVDVTNATTFTLLADIKGGATSANDFTVNLVPGGVTISTGLVETFGTFSNVVDVTALEADFTQNADDATAFADEDDVTLLDFTVNSNGTQLVNSTLTFTFSTDVTNILENFDLQVGGVNVAGVETYPLTGGGTLLTVTGFTAVDVTNATIFTLLADIKAGVTSANDFTVNLVPGGVTISTGLVETFGTFSNTVDVTGLEADFTQNTDDATAFADQNGVELLDFTVNSNGTQTISPNLVFTFNTNVTGILENWDLRVAGADIPGTEIYTLNGAGTQLTISGFTGVDVTNATNFQLFADIQVGATPTNDFTISLVPGGVTIAPGIVEAFGTFSNAIDIIVSTASDILLTGGTTTPISYRGYQGTTIGPGQPAAFDAVASVSLADYSIRDGGGSADGDTKGMSVSAIEIQVTNIQNVRTIALFDDGADTEIAGTEQDVSALGPGTVSIIFTPSTPISVADGGTFNFNVRASFRAAVTDNHPIRISIISATASPTGSGFSAVGTWASTQTAINQNTIAVVASKFIFSSITPSTQAINAPITVTVQAVDQTGFQNLDVDYTGKVDLTRTPGGGTFTAAQSFTGRNLVAGQFQWTNVQFSTSNTYTLEVSDDAYTDPPDNQANLGDRQNDITITATNSTLDPLPVLNLCYGGSFQTLGNIGISETDASGFSTSGSFSIALPTGFVFDTGGSPPTLTMSNSTTTFSAQSFTGGNIFQFDYSIASPTGLNKLTIGNLRVRYPGSTAPSGGVQITRSGGTAVIAGVGPGTQLGTVNAALGTPPGSLGFTVIKVNPTDTDVNANETRFSQSSNAVRLVGSPAGGVFSGPGVVFVSGEYRFNPQSLALSPPLYDIVYTYTEGAGQNCQFTVTKQFEVYSTNITGLNTQYCTNDVDSPILHVTETYIDLRFGANYNLKKFVYWNYDPTTLTYFQTDITPLVANTGGNIADGGPAQSVVFNPDHPAYAQVYVQYASPGMWVGFIVEDPITLLTQIEWTFIRVRTAPTPTISTAVIPLCADDLAITLVGSPPNSNTPSDDFFSGTGVNVTPSNPRIWTFSPSAGSTSITYTYRDPVTGCSATSPAKAFTVNPRPLGVAASVIAGSIAPETCEGIPIGTFKADNPPLTSPDEYRWYRDISLTTRDGTGNNFSPPTPVPVNPNVAGTTKFYVTQVINGCESNRVSTVGVPALELSVIVKATPPQPVGNFDREYCVGTTVTPADLVISVPVGVIIRWYKVGDPTVLLDNVSAPTAAQISGALGINTASAATYSFNVTQTTNGCEGLVNPTRVNVIIKALPVVDISNNAADLQKVCTSGNPVTFTGSDSSVPVTSGLWETVDGPTFPVGALSAFGGTAILNPANVPPNDYKLRFRYTNAGNCASADTIILKVPPSINRLINPLDSCEGLFIRFNNESSLNLGPFSATISQTLWKFNDGGSELPLGSGPVPYPGTNGGKTKGTYFSPEHRYTTTGSFTVQYTMETSDGCSYSGTKQINVNNKPNIDFTWHDPCYDSVSGRSRTFFTAVELSTPSLAIEEYEWVFNVNNHLDTLSTVDLKTATPIAHYNKLGTDTVELIATTFSQCRDTVQRAVYVLPTYKAITDTSGYDQNFNNGRNFWIQGGFRSSWDIGSTMAGSDASNGDAWATGLSGPNNDGERSWVMSGCFNFSDAKKPVVSLDTWSDTPFGIDGAVFQFNEDGYITTETSWEVLGETGTGINWYDGSGISNSPGNQTANDYGWTGLYPGWKESIYRLDDVKPATPTSADSLIIFRIAFGGGNGQRSGFAFDNVFIGERSRVVLLESFTNTNPDPLDLTATNNHNLKYQTFGDVSTGELVKIQYHTPFPGTDALNAQNQQMNNSRAAFYGITGAPAARVDGSYENGALPTWLDDYNDDRVLTPSVIRLDSTGAKKSGTNVKVGVRIQNTSSQDIPLDGINVFVVVVQKEILRSTEPNLFGATNSTEFVYVAKQMLPSAAGTPLSGVLLAGQPLALDSITWSHPNGGDAIVVFLQKIDSENKPVLQAFLLENPPTPNVITGTEDPEYAKHIYLYPNPANNEVNIELPSAVSKPTPVALSDAYGRVVYQSDFKAGEQTKRIPTSALANGIYMMQILTPQGNKVLRKVMVKH